MSAINISKHAMEKKTSWRKGPRFGKSMAMKISALEQKYRFLSCWYACFISNNASLSMFYTLHKQTRKSKTVPLGKSSPVSDRCCRIRCGNIVAPDPLLGDISRSREIHTFNHEENSIWSVSNYRSILYRDKVHKFRHETI